MRNSIHHRGWQLLFSCPLFILFGTQQHHLRVRKEIINFVSENVHLFEALVISDHTSYTLLDQLESMKHPMVWATQVETQAAVDLYGIPVYLFTPNLSGSRYQWYHYNKRTLAVPHIQYHHLELAHCHGNHFDCIVDAATVCQVQSLQNLLENRPTTQKCYKQSIRASFILTNTNNCK